LKISNRIALVVIESNIQGSRGSRRQDTMQPGPEQNRHPKHEELPELGRAKQTFFWCSLNEGVVSAL
jgi:hypothetical protein